MALGSGNSDRYTFRSFCFHDFQKHLQTNQRQPNMRQKKHLRRSKFGKLFRAGSAMFNPMIRKRKKVRRFGSIDTDFDKPLIMGSEKDVARTIKELRANRNEPWMYMENYEQAKAQLEALDRDRAHFGYHQPTEDARYALKHAIGEADDEIVKIGRMTSDKYLKKYGSTGIREMNKQFERTHRPILVKRGKQAGWLARED